MVAGLETIWEKIMSFLQRIFGSATADAAPFLKLKADIHSHLIPGIDDGSASLEESMAMIRELHALGYRKLVTTPHVMSDAYRNTPETIRQGLADLQQAVAAEGLDIELEAAAEYYLDEVFAQTLGSRELLSFGGSNKYILFETSYVSSPMVMNDVVFELQTCGYKPVLAHPERYQYLWNEDATEEVRILRSRGILIQVNLTSFGGRYSKRAASIARDLAQEGLIDFIGTDLHRPIQVDTLKKTYQSSKELRALIDSGKLLNTSL
jgi:protein-tyrosine phosphatase